MIFPTLIDRRRTDHPVLDIALVVQNWVVAAATTRHGRLMARATRRSWGPCVSATVIACALSAAPASGQATSPSSASAVTIPPGQIAAAVGHLDGLARDLLTRTGVPGMAIAVVHDDKVVYANGFGVRSLADPAPVDANTVFQLASVSKPIAATVVARAVGERRADWNGRISRYLPSFALADPYATADVTVADLFAHRSGLPDHLGDILEDLGTRRAEIQRRLRLAPLTPLRQDFAYNNFGISAGAFAVARQVGTSWENLSERTLYRPLGMASTSSRHRDFLRRANRASLHVQDAAGRWKVGGTRDPDAQSPAGGVSSSARDLAQWMRLLLADGMYDGRRLIRADALRAMRTPTIALGAPATPDSRTGMSGLGIDITVDATGRVRLTHSGAFTTGGSTHVSLLPAEKLGIVVLTNGWQIGVPEALASSFLDLAEQGHVTRDWFATFAPLLAASRQNTSRLLGRTRPRTPRPARVAAFYAGTYRNAFYGRVRVVASGGRLTLVLGPKGRRFALSHWSGDTYALDWSGENEYGIGAVDFGRGRGGRARSVRVEVLAAEGLGTFRRG
jgi:CubicO group peptidase (beta-lactamase class C family)